MQPFWRIKMATPRRVLRPVPSDDFLGALLAGEDSSIAPCALVAVPQPPLDQRLPAVGRPCGWKGTETASKSSSSMTLGRKRKALDRATKDLNAKVRHYAHELHVPGLAWKPVASSHQLSWPAACVARILTREPCPALSELLITCIADDIDQGPCPL